jgi:uncharacterized membrane protein
MADEIRRAVTINRPQGELEKEWHTFSRAEAWREHLRTTQLVPQPHSRGTVLRVITAGTAEAAQVEAALRRFKAKMEAGEVPTNAGQPEGGRGVLERWKQSLTPEVAPRAERHADGHGQEHDTSKEKAA